jgi:hypothetical protein
MLDIKLRSIQPERPKQVWHRARLFTSLSFESRIRLFGSSKLFAGNKNSQFNVPQYLKAFISSLFDTNIRI